MLIGKEECGCEIIQEDIKVHIEYCPLHKVAPRLYEACQVALAKSHNPKVEEILMTALIETMGLTGEKL